MQAANEDSITSYTLDHIPYALPYSNDRDVIKYVERVDSPSLRSSRLSVDATYASRVQSVARHA